MSVKHQGALSTAKVLEVLIMELEPLRTTEIGRKAVISRDQSGRILETLATRGLVKKSSDGWFLGSEFEKRMIKRVADKKSRANEMISKGQTLFSETDRLEKLAKIR